METEIRRRCQILFYSGRAFILFGLWSTIKMFLWMYLKPFNWEEMFETAGVEQVDMDLMMKLMFYVLIIAFILGTCLRLYIGLSAIRESKGKKKKFTYVIMAMIYMGMIFYTNIQLFNGVDNNKAESLWMSLALDITNVIILTEMIINAWKLRKLRG